MIKDTLSKPEREELKNVMLNEPVHPGHTISHHTAKSLSDKGLIKREPKGPRWVTCWNNIKPIEK
jgi:hypothetical protein